MKHFYLAKTHPSPKHQIFKNNLWNFHLIVSKKMPPPPQVPPLLLSSPLWQNPSPNIQRVHPRGRIDAAGLRLNHTMLFGGFIFMAPSESFAPQGKSVQEGQNTGVAPSITTTHNACKWVLQNNSPKSSTLLLKGISTIHFGALLLQFAKSHVFYGFAWNWQAGKHQCTPVHPQNASVSSAVWMRKGTDSEWWRQRCFSL